MVKYIKHIVGSVWVAADGEHYGYIVSGPTDKFGETPVRRFDEFKVNRSSTLIDSFKLTYRYRCIFPRESPYG